MAVDYTKSSPKVEKPETVPPISLKQDTQTVTQANGPVTTDVVDILKIEQPIVFVPAKPTVEQVFLALLTAHTQVNGGIKYWRVEKNVPSNIKALKDAAQKIVEAY